MSRATPRGKAARALAWALGALISLIALLLLAWLAAPGLLRSQLETRGSEALGRALRVERVEIEPWRLAVALHGVSVAAADASAPPQLQVARIAVDASIASLWRLEPVIEALEVDAPRLRIARTAAGHSDLDDVLARVAAAAAAPAASPAEPARFALFNLQLHDGTIDIDDRPLQRHHQVRGLRIALPFLSNLPEDVQVTVRPLLEMTLDDGHVALRGEALPFAPDRATLLDATLDATPLVRWWAYWPASLPLIPEGGRLAARVALRFSQPPREAPRIAISGSLTLTDFTLRRPGGAPMLAWQSASVQMQELRPLERRLDFGDVLLQGLQADVRRDAQGRIEWATLGGATDAPPVAAPAPPWTVSVQRIELQQAALRWSDAGNAAAYTAQPLALRVEGLRWPAAEPSPFTLSAALLASGRSAGQLDARGTVTPQQAQLELKIDKLPLAAAAPYLRPLLAAGVDGRLGAQATLRWRGGDDPQLTLHDGRIELDALRVTAPGGAAREPALALAALRAEGLQLDLLQRTAALARLELKQPALRLHRDEQGRIDAAQWLVPPPAAAAPAADNDAPWRATLRELLLDGGRIRFVDEAVRPGSRRALRLHDVRVAAQGLQWPAGASPLRWQLAARVPPARGEDETTAPDGRFDARGQLTIEPLAASATLQTERLPVHAFEPWFGDALPYRLTRAELGWRGDVSAARSAAGWRFAAQGALRVADLQLYSREAADLPSGDQELLRWNALDAQPLAVSIAPGSAPRVEIGELALSDFYSRLVITEQGRFNLRDAPQAAASAAAPAASAAPVEFPLQLSIGRTRLAGGHIDFRDRFVRPSYAAALTELNGSIGRLASGTREMAPIELRGRVAGTGLLEIRGALNPMASPPALDLSARASDLELAPLSPYSGKYAGYAIERGKLSVDVAYRIDADGRLQASNQLVLNQLTLGEKVDSPEATKLPVRLALALLTDRNGVIDIDLPIAGSINDPEFSVFGLVLKAIGNLLAKALTAPFSLLAGGGSEELSVVEFEPGTAQLAASGRPVLERIARALAERPALRLTVQGSADPAAEAEAMKDALLEARLAGLWQREQARAARAGAAASAATPAVPAIPGAERQRMLERLYAETPLPDKPRYLIGLAKALPAAEMQARLKAALPLPAEAARELALQRSLAVRDALVARGLPAARLFLAAPLLRGAGDDAARWTPRVQLSLAGP